MIDQIKFYPATMKNTPSFCSFIKNRLVERAGSLRDVSQGVALGLRDVARGEHVLAPRPDHLEHPAALARTSHGYSFASCAARRISRSATSAGLVFHRS